MSLAPIVASTRRHLPKRKCAGTLDDPAVPLAPPGNTPLPRVPTTGNRPNAKHNRKVYQMTHMWKTIMARAAGAAACSVAAWMVVLPRSVQAQTLPPIVFQLDIDNVVIYVEDTFDVSKFATNPNITPAASQPTFSFLTGIGDIVAVNGQPAKGTWTYVFQRVNLTTVSAPGRSIADTSRQGLVQANFEILSADGTPIGTIMCVGLGGTGTPPPGAPSAQIQGNSAVVGGTGAFVGVHGIMGAAVSTGLGTVANRQASIVEDPAFRRQNGGGKSRMTLLIVPSSRPQVIVTANGPAIAHSSDFTLVSASKPAAAGEILSLFASGLGPSRPGVDPGQPFPTSPLAAVNSPVSVLVNGETAEVLAAVGYPGAVDAYQVNFRLPSGTAKGTAVVQVSAAWVPGPSVNIMVQ